MKRINCIILTSPDNEPEAWGNFKKLCEAKKFPYHSLKDKKFPVVFEDFTIYKVKFN